MQLNTHYQALQESYLFSDIARKVNAYEAAHPEQTIIKMGIGDVTQPLCQPVIDAMQEAVAEMATKSTFKGYGPEQGYGFIREGIQGYYAHHGVVLDTDEVFVSDGAKSDIANILDLFAQDNVVAIPDPVYPVYVDTNIMQGRKIVYLDAVAENGFLPLPTADLKADIIYLCSPNNPTGAVYNREQLKAWVDYANAQQAIILFDAAYEAFIQDKALPRSIYEIEGAKTCAIEFCSYSKTAGFTGMRCGYTIVPKTLERSGISLNKMWLRRQTTKFNGASYIIQKGAAALYTEAGAKACQEAIAGYLANARHIRETFEAIGIPCVGGEHSPYVWIKCEGFESSWGYFDNLLEKAQVVGTPGVGFGNNGEGYFRLTGFNTAENTVEAMKRIRALYGK